MVKPSLIPSLIKVNCKEPEVRTFYDKRQCIM